jgi:hypothetical protein
MLAVSLCKAVNFYHSVRHDEEFAAQPTGLCAAASFSKKPFS